MTRFLLLAAPLVVVATAMPAQCQDSDDVKRLTDHIKALEAKLEAAKAETQRLRRENAQLRAVQQADDGFGVGAKFAGPYAKTWTENGRRVSAGMAWEFEVTGRSGREFTATIIENDGKVRAEVEGTIFMGAVAYRVTKYTMGNRTTNAAGHSTFAGRLDGGTLTGTVTKSKADPSYRGEVRLKEVRK